MPPRGRCLVCRHNDSPRHYYINWDSQTIAVAEGYLRQLDLRKRQVAVEIKIINIDLSNGMTVDNSVYYKTKGGQWLISSPAVDIF